MVAAAVVVFILYKALREIETWLHQHIFKVGWLVTKDFQITTILYYTFFLPGVILYELAIWLMAGVLDVRAEHTFKWPEKQEMGELKLNYVRISKKAPAYKVTIINASPLLMGLAVIWLIINIVLNVQTFFIDDGPVTLTTLSDILRQLTTAPDFWLWAYVLFTISNTMIPEDKLFKRWWWGVGIAGLIAVPLFILGVGQEVIGGFLNGTVKTFLIEIAVILGTAIFLDIAAVAVLGTVESVIERITGNSATFKNGKMVVMKRAEVIEQRKQEKQKAYAQKRPQQQKVLPAKTQGPPSVYNLEFPIPGAPGQEPITQVVSGFIEPEAQPEKPSRPRREEPDVVTTTAEVRLKAHNRSDNTDTSLSHDDAHEDIETSKQVFASNFAQKPAAEDQNNPTDDEDEITYEDVEDSA